MNKLLYVINSFLEGGSVRVSDSGKPLIERITVTGAIPRKSLWQRLFAIPGLPIVRLPVASVVFFITAICHFLNQINGMNNPIIHAVDEMRFDSFEKKGALHA